MNMNTNTIHEDQREFFAHAAEQAFTEIEEAVLLAEEGHEIPALMPVANHIVRYYEELFNQYAPDDDFLTQMVAPIHALRMAMGILYDYIGFLQVMNDELGEEVWSFEQALKVGGTHNE